MPTFSQFPEEVAALQRIAEEHELHFHHENDSEVMIVADSFVLGVSLDRDGVSIDYYDMTDHHAIVDYAIGFLLMGKRNPLPEPLPTYPDNNDLIRHELHYVIETLKNHAADVLQGRRDWIAEYDMDTVVVRGDQANRLMRVFMGPQVPDK